ncbi:sterol desaturase family protein [Veronia pacifica]|uniref:Fatty acid hydroxylase domain-containing protein n=1 Tax=Veronia pacifica TaxID=1080227 RepID=A0A1C3EK69_9GAMM|nr:sterol desaturase family protein [Veronia pacifica]ODA33628.1 hypothetical protein A8L45_09605 [Veronia pacifica]
MLESYEVVFRLSAFIGIFVIMAIAERLAPKRALRVSWVKRWLNNLGLLVVDTITVRLLFPVAAAGFAVYCQQQGWGLLNIFAVPYWLAVLISVIVMDFIIWGQHLMFHRIPVLWRLHAVHHADRDLDVSSGGRFHPIEIILSMLIKFVAIACLGAPAAAVILFEIILNGTSMFNHSNVALPNWLDRIVRRLIVTPDMHRIHHSVRPEETNSNYGFNFSFWDKLFGTYNSEPKDGHDKMDIGLSQFQTENQTVWITGLLALPFRNQKPSDQQEKTTTNDK